jgi:hypothetical protein
VRYALLAALIALACRGERPADRPPGASRPPAEASAVSDAELVTFVRWQREFMEVSGRMQAETDAIQPDTSKPPDESVREATQRHMEVTERYAPSMRKLYQDTPFTEAKRQLVTEAIGGLYHWEYTRPDGARLVIVRDEERIGAARRKFGEKAVNDILAREPLIMAELQRP